MAQGPHHRRREALAELARRASYQYERNPLAYRHRLAWLVLIGVAVRLAAIVLALGGFLAVLALALASDDQSAFPWQVAIAILLLPLAWALWKGVLAKPAAARGYPLPRSRFRQLHADLDALRGELRLPRVHRVMLTDDFDIELQQVPRLGVFGWNRNTLRLGLPLMLSLSADQARALLTHELAHFSRNHDFFGALVYRLRRSWQRTMEALDTVGGLSLGLLRRFWDRFAPYFGAYSFALARANEFEADLVAARITSPRDTALALVVTEVNVGILDDHYWQPLLRRAHDEPEPSGRAFSDLHRFMQRYPMPRQEVLMRIRRALRTVDDESDTHPTLRERLAAIGAPPEVPVQLESSAAEYWLVPHLDKVLADFDTQWHQAQLEQWKQRHAQALVGRVRLEELSRMPQADRSSTERWELASLTDRYEPNVDALPLYEAFLHDNPENFDAQLAVGRLLARRGDARGIALLEGVLTSFHHVIPACEAAYAYFKDLGDDATARVWEERAGSQLTQYERALRQRARLTRGDEFFAPRFAREVMDALRQELGGDPRVRHAWICEKYVTVLPEQPVYVIVVETRERFAEHENTLASLRETVSLPGTVFVIGKRGKQAALVARAIRSGSPIV
jgi:Zn-dependent protease with chaperone function